MITLNVARVLRLKAIKKPYSFLTANGFGHHTAYCLVRAKFSHLPFRHLEKLCRILHCEPHDLLDYTPDKNAVPTDSDHLAFLKKEVPVPIDFHAIIGGLSPQEMQSLTNEIAQRFSKCAA